MNIAKETSLEQISKKHLQDSRSDELYKPFRDLNLQFSLKKFQPNSQRYEKLSDYSQNSYLPSYVKGLQISKDRILPSKGFKKVAERQKTYQPIPEGVLKILQEEYRGPQKTVYKYSDCQSNQELSYRYKSVIDIKSAQNRSNLKQNFQKRMERIEQIQDKNQGYNLYSILDEPLSYIRSKI